MGRLVDAEDLMVNICKEYDRKADMGQTGSGLKLAWIESAVNDTPTAELSSGWIDVNDRLHQVFTDIYNAAPGSDQTAKADAGKARLSLVPRKIIWAIARIREFGCKKYKDPDNWKRVEVDRYKDAAFRHFLQYLDDPKSVDQESGLPHLYHLACNIAFLCEMEDNK